MTSGYFPTFYFPMIERLLRFAGPEPIYLVDHLPKSAKIGIDSLTGPITTRSHSHKGAWARIIRAQLTQLGYQPTVLTKDSRWDAFDAIILDHGMEYNGVFNVYGGANDDLAARLKQFLDYQGLLISYEVQMPDLGAFVKARLKSSTDGFKTIATQEEALTVKSQQVKFADAVALTGKLLVGDSHALSVWKAGYEIRRYDGQTLHGLLKKGLESTLYGFKPWKEVIFYFGNIDIRHHLCRQENPKKAVLELAYSYMGKIADSFERFDDFKIVELLPIENEDRSIPKTGYYEGKPFHGTREQRQELVDIFNEVLKETCPENLINWNHLKREENGSLSFDSMERPQSVHVSPDWYHFNIETGTAWSPIIETSEQKEPTEKKSSNPAEKRPNIVSVGEKISRNVVYHDLLEYHAKATLLERRAQQEPNVPLPDDPLMCNVHIYDSVHRYCAGFSNLLEEFHYPNRVGKLRNDRVDRLPLAETLYIYLLHRVTGSAASFRPRPPEATTRDQLIMSGAHGYYNTILPKIWDKAAVKEMTDVVLCHEGPYLTSKGNIPPQFKAVVGGFDKPSREYLCYHAPQLIDDVIQFIRAQKRGIREVVDFMNAWNKKRTMISFSFCYTAFANDLAEYWPELVDPFSHTYYGSNCLKTLNLAFDGSARPRARAFDQVIEWLVEDTGFKPFDLEDTSCDQQRYWTEEVPEGYGHLNHAQTRNNSTLKKAWGEAIYYDWVAKNIHQRNSGLTVTEANIAPITLAQDVRSITPVAS